MMTCTTPIGPGLLKPGSGIRQCDLPTAWRCEDCDAPLCRWHAAAGHFKHRVVLSDAMNTAPTEDE